MIDLNQYPKIQADLDSKVTSLTPLIVIDDDIYIASYKQSLNIDSETSIFFEDRGLKLNSIKESIDLVTRKFKINKNSFTLSNYSVNGIRFSDIRDITGKNIDFYYRTQTCTDLSDCLLVYKGIVRRYQHDTDTVKIEVEDLTDNALRKKVPISSVDIRKKPYSNKYRDKPIPITYGRVDRAPAIPIFSPTSSSLIPTIDIVCDDVLNINRDIKMNAFSDDNPLMIYKDDYYNVLKTYEIDKVVSEDNYEFADYNQYAEMNGYVQVQKRFGGNAALNPPADNEFQCIKRRYPNDLKLIQNPAANEDVEFSTWDTTLGFGIHFLQPSVHAPEYSFDNKDFVMENSYDANLDTNYRDTNTSIPDNSVPLGDNASRVANFIPCESESKRGVSQYYGRWDGGYGRFYQRDIVQWLTRYAHMYNDEETSRLSFMRFPATSYLKEEVNKKLWFEYYLTLAGLLKNESFRNDIANQLIGTQYESERDLILFALEKFSRDSFFLHWTLNHWSHDPNVEGEWYDNNFAGVYLFAYREGSFPSLLHSDTESVHQNVSSHISKTGLEDWCSVNGIDADYWTNVVDEEYNGEVTKLFEAYNDSGNDFKSLCTNEEGINIKYPNFYIQFTVIRDENNTVTIPFGSDAWNSLEFPSFSQILPYKFVGCSLDSESHNSIRNQSSSDRNWYANEYGDGGGDARYYNFFETTDSDYAMSAVINNLYTLGDEHDYHSDNYIGLLYDSNFDYESSEWAYNPEFDMFGGGQTDFTANTTALNVVEHLLAFLDFQLNGGITTHQFFPVYTPLELTQKTTPLHEEQSWSWSSGNTYSDWYSYVKPYFYSKWNGVSLGEAIDLSSQSNVADHSYYYFGGRSNHEWRNKESTVTNNGDHNGNEGWFIWVRDDIQGDIGGAVEPILEEEHIYMDIDTRTIIPANTLMSLSHHGKTDSGDSWNYTNHNLPTPTPITTNPDYFFLKGADEDEEDSISMRLGLCFALNSLDIKDDIKTDTYLDAKFFFKSNNWYTGGSNDDSHNNNSRLKIRLGFADLLEEGLDWETFTDEGSLLVDVGLSDFHNNTGSSGHYFNSQLSDGSVRNHFEETCDGVVPYIDQFHDVNNYNGLLMVYSLDAEDDIQLSLDTNIHDIALNHYIIFDRALDDDLYLSVEGRKSSLSDITDDGLFYKYTGNEVEYDDNGVALEDSEPIEKPSDIAYHFLEKEINLIDAIDNEGLSSVRTSPNAINVKLAFSVNEEIEAKELIKEMFESTNIFPLFKATSKFSFSFLRKTYGDDNVDLIIKSEDIIKHSYTRTPSEKIYTMVNVKYKVDYAEDDFSRQTGYVDGYDMFGNGDSINRAPHNGYSYEYLNLDRESNVLEFESKYIRDDSSAIQLRDFIYLLNCNQHTIFKLTLPIKYINLEVGDIVKFDSLIGGIKAYGENYTSLTTRNEQTIYPYFIVSKINKKPEDINVELTQLHKLESNFRAHTGSISRVRGTKNNSAESYAIFQEDVDQFEDYLLGGANYYTMEQKRASDVNSDGYIQDSDLEALHLLVSDGAIDMIGDLDVNADGEVDVTDIVSLVTQIVGETELTEEQIMQFDTNGDGIVNVIDIINVVNEILGS